MNDRQISEMLTRYRPVEPDEGVRARVLAQRPPVGRVWPWAAAAAALLAATIGLHTATSRRIATYNPEQAGADAVDSLTAALGGDRTARRMAEWIVLVGERRREPLRPE